VQEYPISMRRSLLFLLSLAQALTLGIPALAQDRLNGFYLTSPMSLSSGYDDHFATGSQALSDNVSLVTSPTFSWLENTHQTMLSLDYQSEFEIFDRYQNLDAWNHAANLHFRHQITSRLSLDAADAFLSTMDPTRVLVNSLLLLPRGRYVENAFYARLAYRLDHRTVFSVRFDNAYTTMELPEALAGRLNRVGFAGTATVDRTINRHHALSGSYAYLYVHPLQTGPSAIGTGVQNVNLAYVYTVNPGLTLRASGGITRADQSSFTGAAAVDKKVGGVWLSGGYQRYLAFFGGLAPIGVPAGPLPFVSGLAPDSIYQVASLRAWGNLTNRLSLEGNLQRALNGVTPEGQGIKSVVAQLRLSYKVTDRVSFFTRTEFYGQNISEFSTFPMSRRRYFAGIEISLTRPPEVADDPHRHKPLPAGSSMSQQGDAHAPEDH
jgi:sulfur relay (sulfurtransferase) DsrF/TusC family protein